MTDRFANHPDSPFVQNAAQQAVAQNYDYLADNVSEDLARAYLATTVNKGDSKINNTGMAQMLGWVINDYQPGGKANAPKFTVDPRDSDYGVGGRTLRLGKAPSTNWDKPKKLAKDTRQRYDLPEVDLTRKA